MESTSTNPESDPVLKEFYVPTYILVADSSVEKNLGMPSCPVVVFINSKSGGQLGGDLLLTFRSLLNKHQVFDLTEEAPDKALRRLYLNIEKLKINGDEFATRIEEKLRLIVAGGDGTAGWLLGVVSDLRLSQPPSIATMPLGTGNNLPFAFGWGKKNPGTDRQSVLSFLEQVSKAKDMMIDSWHIMMRMRVPSEGTCDPIAPLELPHSLHAFHRVSASDELNMEGYHTFRGGFWNYFSMGMDAEVSYAFHSERKLHPEKFKNQLVNQSTYAKLGCTQGWFFASLKHPSSRNIAQLAKVKVMKRPGEWTELQVPHSIRSIVCLNLPSFSGGLNPWGTPSKLKRRDRDLTPPYVDDGMIEVVGFRDAWHGLVLLAPNGHGTRLAQANRVRFEFHKGGADHTFMRIDGEPWKQPLPVDDDTVIVEISHLRQVKILATVGCRAKSFRDPSTPHNHDGGEDGDSDADEDSVSEEQRKFGAAETFRVPNEVLFNPEIYHRYFSTPLPAVIDKCIQSAPIHTTRALYKVIPPGMEFQHIARENGEAENETGSTNESSGSPYPLIWSEIERFFANPCKPMILALARPDPKKNLINLVKAFGECRQLRDLTNLTLIMGNRGEIDEMSTTSSSVLLSILKLIDKYDLYGHVSYPKHHKQSEVAEIYRLAAKTKGVFINPAFIEPFGLTLIEAAAYGLPTVATKNGGPVDINRVLDNGLLIDPHNQQSIADAPLQLVGGLSPTSIFGQNVERMD